MVSIYGGGGGGGFDYVQDPAPQDPKEGEEWYDTGSDSAFVFDGSAWIEQTITTHDKLSGVSSNQHHSRPNSTDTRWGSWKDVEVSWSYTEGEQNHSIPSGEYRRMMVNLDQNNGFRIAFNGPNGESAEFDTPDRTGIMVSPDLGGDTYDTITTYAGGVGADFAGRVFMLETTHSHTI